MRESRKPNDIDAILSRHEPCVHPPRDGSEGWSHCTLEGKEVAAPCDAHVAATEALRLREALEWYANAPDLDPDVGLRARAALEPSHD